MQPPTGESCTAYTTVLGHAALERQASAGHLIMQQTRLYAVELRSSADNPIFSTRCSFRAKLHYTDTGYEHHQRTHQRTKICHIPTS